VGRVAQEAEALAAVVGNAMRRRQVRGGHADAQHLWTRRTRRQCWHRRGARRSDEATSGEHEAFPFLCGVSQAITASAAMCSIICTTVSVSITSQNACAIADSVALCSSSLNVALPSATKNTL